MYWLGYSLAIVKSNGIENKFLLCEKIQWLFATRIGQLTAVILLANGALWDISPWESWQGNFISMIKPLNIDDKHCLILHKRL